MSYVPPSQTPSPTPNYSSPPPPPPPPSYYYPPQPASLRRGFFSGITKLGGVLSFAFLLIAIGFYACLIVMTHANHLTPVEYREGKGMDRIAIIPITGTIGDAMVEFSHDAADAVIKDDSIKAVILRVESGGGGATASDQILHEINRIREERHIPIVSSFGFAAASGGYYVACQSDFIYAEPTSITGSIGVMISVPTLQDLLEKKLGVKFVEIAASGSPEKLTANTLYRDWTEKDRGSVQHMVDSMYATFSDVVAKGRKDKIPADKLAGIANGMVYNSPEAKANGLIDDIGYLDAAITKAGSLAKLKEAKPPVVIFRKSRGLLASMGLSSGSSGGSGMLDAGAARTFIDDLTTPRVEMRMR